MASRFKRAILITLAIIGMTSFLIIIGQLIGVKIN